MNIFQSILYTLSGKVPVLLSICALLWLGLVCIQVRRSHKERSRNPPRSIGRKALATRIRRGSPDIAGLWSSDGTGLRQTDSLQSSRPSVPIINPATGFPMLNGMGGVDMTGSPFGFDVRAPCNPANGLPMVNGMWGVDVAGNPYGTAMRKLHGSGHDGFQ